MTIEIISETGMMEPIESRLVSMRVGKKHAPFAAPLLKFTNEFSNLLLKDKEARAYPELQALGFWLREMAIKKIKNTLIAPPSTIAVPQGVVFHIPPSNVATMFAYSLFMSLLCGNANIVRLPSQRTPAMMILLRLLCSKLDKNISKQLLILGYSHNETITEMLSRAADLRVIWGGDAAVATLRSIPAAPFTRELIFPDRFSWSAIETAAFKTASRKTRQELAFQYSDDLFWFQQQGCSSPRILMWHGLMDKKLVLEFYSDVAAKAAKTKWGLDEGSSVLAQTKQFSAMADMNLALKRTFGSLTVFTMKNFDNLPALRDNPCFGGTLFECSVKKLSDITPHIERRDQTLTYFGFKTSTLKDFAIGLNGRGFDRIVRIGQALTFDSIWDGYDLPAQFTRWVKIA